MPVPVDAAAPRPDAGTPPADAGITQLTARVVRRGSLARTGERIDRGPYDIVPFRSHHVGRSLGYAIDDAFYGIGEPGYLQSLKASIDKVTPAEVKAVRVTTRPTPWTERELLKSR